jgi:DNA primase
LQNIDTYVKNIISKADERYADWSEKDRLFEAARLLRHVVTEHKKKKKNVLMQQLRDAEATHDDKSAQEIRAELNKLIKEAK